MRINFSNPNVGIATTTDIPAIKDLLNSAYRGEVSKQGWTTEAYLIDGDQRTDEASLKNVMGQERTVFLKYTNEQQQLIGCVNLQQQGNRIYLGMFSVSPRLQGGGIGKQLLQAAEEYASQLRCNSIYMSVVSVRSELIDWYKRHGYSETGERKPFVESADSGKHLQPLEFSILQKTLLPGGTS
jgi:ribosomal protein S18 acetylase RimI-like enzyme